MKAEQLKTNQKMQLRMHCFAAPSVQKSFAAEKKALQLKKKLCSFYMKQIFAADTIDLQLLHERKQSFAAKKTALP